MRTHAFLALLLPFAIANADEQLPKLYPGAKAPVIKVAEWIKNGELKNSNRFKVVEFWATWCGPCRTSIPHLTELARKYKDKVDFVGVSVYEQGDDIPGKVRKFVLDMGDKMDYRVAIDTTDKVMAKTWMEAAEQPGIPTAFLVDGKGKVVWIGHPMELATPLQQALDKKLDAKKTQADFMVGIKAQRAEQKIQTDLKAAVKTYKDGNKVEAEKQLDAIIAANPGAAAQVNQTRLFSLYKASDPEAKALVTKYLAGSEADLTLLARYASMQASAKDGDKEAAKTIANAVFEKSNGSVTLYFVCNALFGAGDYANTLKAIDKTLAVLEKDPDKAQYETPIKQGLDKLKTDATAKLAENK